MYLFEGNIVLEYDINQITEELGANFYQKEVHILIFKVQYSM